MSRRPQRSAKAKPARASRTRSRAKKPRQPAARARPRAQKPHQPKQGPRVNPKDPVEEASYESFPASDPPAFGKRDHREPIPPGQPVPDAALKQRSPEEQQRLRRGRGEDMDIAAANEELAKDRQRSRDDVHERDRSKS